MTPTLIVSGSMGPTITAGDVVMVGSPEGRTVERGHVITFDDPARPGRLLTHRVAAIHGDGTYRTRGDANAHPDSTRVEPAAVLGVGRILVPAVGVPLMWIRTQAWLNLLLWVGGSFLALGYLRLYGHRLPIVGAWSTPLILPAPPRPNVESEPAWERPVTPRWRRLRWAVPAVVAILIAAGLSVPRLAASHAAFNAETASPANSWVASSNFCPSSVTLHPTADARIADGAAADGSALTIGVTNKTPVAKSLLAFDVDVPATCTLTAASLQLRVATGGTGRTLSASAVDASWDEETVVWGTEPGTTGHAAVPAPSGAPGTWVSFNSVAAHVDAIRAGTAFGFIVSSDTGGPPGTSQTFHSRDAATDRPQLVLSFSGATAPSAPTGLSAIALSATRVGLEWTDTSGGSAGFRVQRSPGGAGTWSTIQDVPAGTTTYTDTGLEASTSYDYRVRATGAGGVSEPSDVASVTTPAPPAAPDAPMGLTATATGVDTVDVSWSDGATNEDGYLVQRSDAGADTWEDAGTVGADITTLADDGLTAGTVYDYRVAAFNAGGYSAWTSVATVTTDGCATLSSQTLLSEADALILEGSGTPYGGTTTFGVRSSSSGDGRSLVRFPAPAVTGGCSVTSATLRLRTTTTRTAGRELLAETLDAAWTEGTVLWSAAITGSGSTGLVATDATTEWYEWDVTTFVGPSGTGAPHGFMIRDAAENSGTIADNGLQPREAGDAVRPQLVVRFD